MVFRCLFGRSRSVRSFVWVLGLFVLVGPTLFCRQVSISEGVMKGTDVRVLKKQDHGKEIVMNVGEVIQVELEPMGSAGYQWSVVDLDAACLEVLPKETRTLSGTDRIGAPVIEIWKFRARKKGSFDLMMRHYRPWEGVEKSTQSFSLRLVIR